jgi:pyridoxal phosphate enzyme (YggS family)|tara:strand:- start:967 stop:1632 length:666 start_codon:yes stop_codon:yes gene_type:complete
MHNSVDNLIAIQKEIQLKISKNKISNKLPEIIAVSKTFKMENIIPLINHGHLNFGENKVQEAIEKWGNIKSDFSHLNLHMIGKLQTNKVKYAVSLFDYIHSLDNFKLAEKIHSEQQKQNKKIKILIQVNIGAEDQKSGILISEAEAFYKKCIEYLDLDIVGFMCIPPNDDNVSLNFSKMRDLIFKTGLKELSMGMSNDYLDAVKFESTFLRIGSKIFGKRS